MLEKEWQTLIDVAEGKRFALPPVALIIDSPWLPDYAGITHLDYYFLPDLWLKVNLQVEREFPSIIFLPSFWVEYGMLIEPSGLGAPFTWAPNSMPSAVKFLNSPDDIRRLKVPNPHRDGLMPPVLNLYRFFSAKLKESGQEIKMVASRGPLTTASFVYGLTDLLMGIKLEPEAMKKLLEITTETVIVWLKAQLEAVPSAEGILVLDDIPGLMSPEDYNEFAHPYLKAIFDEFDGKLIAYHNDSNTTHILPRLAELDIHIFNFGKEVPLEKILEHTYGKMAIMGNISPLEVLKDGSPEDVRREAQAVLAQAPDRYFILSVGGGVSPGTPKQNVAVLERIAGGDYELGG